MAQHNPEHPSVRSFHVMSHQPGSKPQNRNNSEYLKFSEFYTKDGLHGYRLVEKLNKTRHVEVPRCQWQQKAPSSLRGEGQGEGAKLLEGEVQVNREGIPCRTNGPRLSGGGRGYGFPLFHHLVPSDLRTWDMQGTVTHPTLQGRVWASQEWSIGLVGGASQTLTTGLWFLHCVQDSWNYWLVRPKCTQQQWLKP